MSPFMYNYENTNKIAIIKKKKKEMWKLNSRDIHIWGTYDRMGWVFWICTVDSQHPN